MDSTPDFFPTAEELFHYLYKERRLRPKDSQQWQLGFLPCNDELLTTFTDQLEVNDDVMVYSNQSVISWEGDTPVMGPETLVIATDGAMDLDGVQRFMNKYARYAEDKGLKLVGIGVDDPFDPFVGYGWMQLEDASWQLSSLGDQGVESGDFIPFVFAFSASAQGRMRSLTDELSAHVAGEIEHKTSEEDGSLVLLHVEATNSHDQLRQQYSVLQAIAERTENELIGVDYYLRRTED